MQTQERVQALNYRTQAIEPLESSMHTLLKDRPGKRGWLKNPMTSMGQVIFHIAFSVAREKHGLQLLIQR
ncbi:hypothetical protein [Pseudomonas parafulva]|uniref:hypothetical protein n=1 Tax=Pseudomonas parafulva TaxID=157782 RepID=UPI0012D341AE|nr:hypothetical protein [Pseudomonas parafulva]